MTDFSISIAPDEEGESGATGAPHVPLSVLRLFHHLLPDGHAWRLLDGKMLVRFLKGLAHGPTTARDFLDAVYGDRFAETTRELEESEYEYGLLAPATEAARREQLAAARLAIGGQSPGYLQDTIQAAGFDVYVHEWWEPETEPREVRDPRDYTEVPISGTVQCRATNQYQCREAIGGPAGTGKQALCDGYLANYPRYFANKNRQGFAPPPIPSTPSAWRYFLYFGGEVFGDDAEIPAARRDEFERLIRKYSPAHLWLVTLVTYT